MTGNIRRVGRFDMAIVNRASMVNRPTQVAVTFADYIAWRNYAVGRT